MRQDCGALGDQDMTNHDTVRVLLVEDDPGDAELVRQLLGQVETARFEVTWVDHLATGLRQLAEQSFDAVLLDLDLPDSDGLEVLPRIQAQAPQVPVIVLTGRQDERLALSAIQGHAADYLVKGQIDPGMLARSIRYAVERKRAEKALQSSRERYRRLVEAAPDAIAVVSEGRIVFVNAAALELFGATSPVDVVGRSVLDFVPPDLRGAAAETIRQREASETREDLPPLIEQKFLRLDGGQVDVEISAITVDYEGKRALQAICRDVSDRKQAENALRRTLDGLHRTIDGAIRALAATTAMRDLFTSGHQQRVTVLACAIAKQMGLPEDTIEGIRVAAMVHDIGKISVPAEILTKPARLTEVEFEVVKLHSQASFDTLKSIEFPWPVAEIALQHHERLDGSGYPRGLSGDKMLLEAKVLAVADTVEAMMSHRPYRPAFSQEETMNEIRKNRGVLYDPAVVDACLALASRNELELAA